MLQNRVTLSWVDFHKHKRRVFLTMPVSVRNEKKSLKYANIDGVKAAYRSLSLSALQTEYIKGNLGEKNTGRSAIIQEASTLRNMTARTLSFLFSLLRMGYIGTICPLDVMSESMIKATGGLGAPRSLRRALKGLDELGWITRRGCPTNTKKSTPKGWITLSVLRIEFSEKMHQYLGLSPICTHRPKRPPLLETKGKTQESFGRSLEFLPVTIIQETKKVEQLEAPIVASQTSKPAQLEAPIVASYASNLTKSQNHSQDKKEQKICQTMKTENFNEATSRDLQIEFLKTVEACLFANYQATADKLLIICKNQTDKKYPEHFPRVSFDLIEWCISPWSIQRQKIKEYCELLRQFEEKFELQEENVKKIFLFSPNTKKISFSESVAKVMVLGRMRIDDVQQNILVDFLSTKQIDG